ncbi:hypothetical protein [Streptomyces sp. NPDC001404]|uniref:hypothetical protein n=1 Tax=Streptomyces sp. NPDC001404 TaxID=3364571 RepID=UPI0036B77C58
MNDGYRSWEQREADAQLTRAEAVKVSAEAQATKARAATDQLAEKVKQARFQKQLDAVEDDAAEDRDRRKRRRREALLDSGTRFKSLVTVIIVLGLAASLPGQVSYFYAMGGVMLLSVPFFLELLAWAGVEGTQWAHRKGLPRWPFWLLTGLLAGFAGFINATHGVERFGAVAGYALAATSVIGPVLAEVRQFLESKAVADQRSFEERAHDKAAAKREAITAREQAEKDSAQDEERQRFFPDTWECYLKILALRPEGSVTRDQAWEDATRAVLFPEVWTIYMQLLVAKPGATDEGAGLWDRAWRHGHQLPTGLTSDTLAGEIAAQKRIETVLAEAERTPEQLAVDLFLADVFGPDGDDNGPTGGSPGGGPKQGPGGGSSGARTGALKGSAPLGRKGKQPSGRAAAKVPDKPLDEADLKKVRALAEGFGDASKLSVRNVRQVIGGGNNEYAKRLRDAVQDEWRNRPRP